MARGLTREQLGVTEAMIATYGEAIFRMSHNHQVREGDPVRRLDWEEIARQQEAMGLADVQIAERLGLSREQVMFIRNTEESRRFRTGQQAYLMDLGGGKRFRPERVVPFEQRFRYSDDALRLRAALQFDGQRVAKFISKGWWRDDTLTKWLARHAAQRPVAVALVNAGQSMTSSALAARVDAFAAGLARTGVQAGDVVAVQLPNVPEFVIAYLAICRLGAVMTTLHMPYRGSEFETLLRHSRAKAIVCLAQAREWSPAGSALGLRATLPTLDGDRAWRACGRRDRVCGRSGCACVGDPRFAGARCRRSFPASLYVRHDSVTQGSPAQLPHAPVERAPRRSGAWNWLRGPGAFGRAFLALVRSLRSACVHGGGSNGRVVASLHAAGPCPGRRTRQAHGALDRACAYRRVPCDGLVRDDFSSLKLAIMSGSACPAELVRWFAAKSPNCAVTQLWGMTETQAALYTRPSDSLDVSAASAGRASPGTEVRVVSPDDALCDAGEEGELQVRGALAFPGFYDNAAANESAFAPGGWYRTGDLATMDAAGNVSITGRGKDVINRGGHKFNPRDVEDLLDSHPSILQSAIVPMPDPVLGEKACCFVALRPGAQGVTLEEIVAFLSERNIAKMKFPERLVVVSEMPLTPTRKIIRAG